MPITDALHAYIPVSYTHLYFAVGFPNRSGGYEIRNKLFKGCIAPKDITHIRQEQTKETLSLIHIYTGYVCRQHESRFDWGIDRQMKVTNGYYRELMEANGSLEAVGFREHDRQEEELLERRYERCKREYDKEKAKLDELYRQKEQARREALQCLQNRCGDICRLGGSLLAILEKYLTDQKKKEGEEKEMSASGTTPASPPAYFPMRLLSAIYEKCNGEQFEAVSELDFYASMNLQPCEGRLKTRPREKARVCYLIFLMGETLPKPDREKWKEDIMNLLGIDDAYYKSKYKEPVSDFPSDSNREFAREMRSVFR